MGMQISSVYLCFVPPLGTLRTAVPGPTVVSLARLSHSQGVARETSPTASHSMAATNTSYSSPSLQYFSQEPSSQGSYRQ